MEFIKIENLNNANDIKKIYIDDFPLEERLPFKELLSGKCNTYELYGVYDKGALVAMLHINNMQNFFFINYFAVKKDCQCKGYGSKILKFLKKEYKKSLVVEIEDFDDSLMEDCNRIRRKNFYVKNGFKLGKYGFVWRGISFTYMYTDDISFDEFINHIKFMRPEVKDIYLR